MSRCGDEPAPDAPRHDHRLAEEEGRLAVVVEHEVRQQPGLGHRLPEQQQRRQQRELPGAQVARVGFQRGPHRAQIACGTARSRVCRRCGRRASSRRCCCRASASARARSRAPWPAHRHARSARGRGAAAMRRLDEQVLQVARPAARSSSCGGRCCAPGRAPCRPPRRSRSASARCRRRSAPRDAAHRLGDVHLVEGLVAAPQRSQVAYSSARAARTRIVVSGRPSGRQLLLVALQHFLAQHRPDGGVQLDEARAGLDLGHVARALEVHVELADRVRSPARPTAPPRGRSWRWPRPGRG